MEELVQYKHDIIIQNQKISKTEEFIQKVNKISHIPNLIASIIILLFFPLIFFYPEILGEYLFSYFLVSIISLMVYYYDNHVISPKIKDREYEDVLFDALIWGILGCILYGLGILILIKSLLILGQFINEIDTKKVKEDEQEFISILCTKLYNSLKLCSIKGGIVVILLVLHKVGLIFFEGLVFNLKAGEFFYLLNPFIIFLVISIIVLTSESKWEENIKNQYFIDDFKTTKRFAKSILGCLFYFAGLFILFKIFLEIVCDYYKIDIGKIKYAVKEKGENKESKKFFEVHENKVITSSGLVKQIEESIKTEFDSGEDLQATSTNIKSNDYLVDPEEEKYQIKTISFKSPQVKISKIYIPKIKVRVYKPYIKKIERKR